MSCLPSCSWPPGWLKAKTASSMTTRSCSFEENTPSSTPVLHLGHKESEDPKVLWPKTRKEKAPLSDLIQYNTI